ncbi:uncharacterized protein LOC109832226 [Asparagus officinalis]|uniref:uncharacterized protein LOC109832226 n=1 Tax=Asparagus officinalis TaxID=4686 RepID=UPI00098E6C70|nr:uncharacterized protein LOC109832226 [Asparagus officinalis]
MSRSLFLRIVDAVKDYDYYFQQQSDGLGRMRLSPLQKVTVVFRMLAYGLPVNTTDEYVKIERYLRTPNANDIARLLYIGRSGSPTIILEIVADYDLWIWYAYFGMSDTNNDINVLESSNLFFNLAQCIAPPAHYVIQGKEYNMGYYLADGIYPKWATIVQTIQQPQSKKKNYFAMKHEACRKDVERAFGVLQSRFAIVAGSARFWKKHVLHDIMTACIIMHNMIIEDERDVYAPIQEVREAPIPEVDIVADETTRFTQFITRYRQINDKDAHIALRNALIDHLWEEYTNSDS